MIHFLPPAALQNPPPTSGIPLTQASQVGLNLRASSHLTLPRTLGVISE